MKSYLNTLNAGVECSAILETGHPPGAVLNFSVAKLSLNTLLCRSDRKLSKKKMRIRLPHLEGIDQVIFYMPYMLFVRALRIFLCHDLPAPRITA